jgi:ABC-type nitrate/sulfonate/bicarbonate transport system substrate-binding protein
MTLMARAETLRVSVTSMPVSAPVVYAQEFGYFKKAGLDVEVRQYALGKLALEDMFEGKIDIASAAVTPLVEKFLGGQRFRIFATAATATNIVAVVARNDSGIKAFSDLAGKRVGLARGTSGEFFFETMRFLHRLPRGSVHTENRDVNGLLNGLKDGSLDAVSIWEPQIDQIKKALGNRVSVFYGNGVYSFKWNYIAEAKTIERRRGDLEKFIGVVAEVSKRFEETPETVIADLVKKLGERGSELSVGLKEVTFGPQLGQELLVQMEAEARWMIGRDGKNDPVPNFLRILDSSILKKINPDYVTLIE